MWKPNQASNIPQLSMHDQMKQELALGLLFKLNSVVCMYGHTFSKSKDQPGKVANPARGQLNRGNEYFPVCVRSIQ